MNRIMLLAAGLLLCAAPLCAQIVDHGHALPDDLWARPVVTPVGPIFPAVDVEMDAPNLSPRPPLLQRAHSGLYQDLSGSGAQIDYRHLGNGSAIVKVLMPDGSWGEGFGLVTGAQVLLPLYADGKAIGEVKIGSSTSGPNCGRLKARARFGTKLLFPFDPNPVNCLRAPLQNGQAAPAQPYTYCAVSIFAEKIGEAGAGPETCNLSR